MIEDLTKLISPNYDLLIVLMIVMLLDVITGVIGAFINKEFNSTTFRQGLFKKVYEIILILVAYIIDYVLKVDYIGTALLTMCIGLEIYSIVIENISKYVPIPDWLKDIIEHLRASDKQKEE